VTRQKPDRPPLDFPAMPPAPPDAPLLQALEPSAPPQAPAEPVTPRRDPPASGTGSKARRSRPRQLRLPFDDQGDATGRGR
jgi:hypothetical protein